MSKMFLIAAVIGIIAGACLSLLSAKDCVYREYKKIGPCDSYLWCQVTLDKEEMVIRNRPKVGYRECQ